MGKVLLNIDWNRFLLTIFCNGFIFILVWLIWINKTQDPLVSRVKNICSLMARILTITSLIELIFYQNSFLFIRLLLFPWKYERCWCAKIDKSHGCKISWANDLKCFRSRTSLHWWDSALFAKIGFEIGTGASALHQVNNFANIKSTILRTFRTL